MRILYASQRPPYPFFLGGAARCAHRLLLSLTHDAGVDCAAVGSAAYTVTPWALPPPADRAALGVMGVSPSPAAGTRLANLQTLDCGYPVQLLPNAEGELGTLIDRFAPDVVWSQLEGAPEVLSLARAKGIQGLLYVHDAEDDARQLRAAAATGCHVVCSSDFLARKVSPVIGRPVHVVYPASDWYFGTPADPGGFITLVNPHAVKGLDTFLALARRLPQHRFLLQESWKLGDTALAALHERLAALPNVTFRHRVADMRQVYAQTRLLLAPSVWEEGFGMVAVEAQSCGIPVVASARGGLPESVGQGGVLIDDYLDVNAWIPAVEALLGDAQGWRAASASALAHARSAQFQPQQLARRFVDICRSPAPGVGAIARGLHRLQQGLARVVMLRRVAQREGK